MVCITLAREDKILLNRDDPAKPLTEEDENIENHEDMDIKQVKEDLEVNRSIAKIFRNLLNPVIFPLQLLQSQWTFHFKTLYANDYIEVV